MGLGGLKPNSLTEQPTWDVRPARILHWYARWTATASRSLFEIGPYERALLYLYRMLPIPEL